MASCTHSELGRASGRRTPGTLSLAWGLLAPPTGRAVCWEPPRPRARSVGRGNFYLFYGSVVVSSGQANSFALAEGIVLLVIGVIQLLMAFFMSKKVSGRTRLAVAAPASARRLRVDRPPPSSLSPPPPPLRSTPTTATGTMCPARAAERPCTLRRVYARPTPPLSAAQAAARVGSSRCDIRRQRREPHPDTIALAARHYQGQALRDRRLAWDEGRRVRSDAGRPWWTVQQR